MSRYLVTGLALILGLIGAYTHWQYDRAYDADAVCAKQTDMSPEQCLAVIRTAQAAGW